MKRLIPLALSVMLTACAGPSSPSPSNITLTTTPAGSASETVAPSRAAPSVISPDMDPLAPVLPIDDPLCDSVAALRAVTDFAEHTRPADITAATERLAAIGEELARASGQVEGAAGVTIGQGGEKIMLAASMYRAGDEAEGFSVLTGIGVIAATLTLDIQGSDMAC